MRWEALLVAWAAHWLDLGRKAPTLTCFPPPEPCVCECRVEVIHSENRTHEGTTQGHWNQSWLWQGAGASLITVGSALGIRSWIVSRSRAKIEAGPASSPRRRGGGIIEYVG